ncbi:MAG: response regulator [Nitrospirota bacterium]|jgi:two-component system chemotaxis response regulator CheY
MKTVLIVEDSATTRSMIRSILEDFDEIETVEAATGFEALKQLPAHKVDLVVTDINMPDINGLELINFMRGDERYEKIPIIIISTERSEEDKTRGVALGADAYITKPFSPEDLRGLVREIFAR